LPGGEKYLCLDNDFNEEEPETTFILKKKENPLKCPALRKVKGTPNSIIGGGIRKGHERIWEKAVVQPLFN